MEFGSRGGEVLTSIAIRGRKKKKNGRDLRDLSINLVFLEVVGRVGKRGLYQIERITARQRPIPVCFARP